MRYRVKSGRPVRKVTAEGVSAVQSAIREREDGMSVAMSFEPGAVDDGVLHAHAMDIVMGLLYVRGLEGGATGRARGQGYGLGGPVVAGDAGPRRVHRRVPAVAGPAVRCG